MSINGLELKKIKSEVNALFNDIKSGEIEKIILEHFPEKAFAAAFLDDRVLIGVWEDVCFRFFENQSIDHESIQRIRVFDKNSEFHGWRSRGKMNGRLRKDNNQGKDVDIVVASQVLFGTDAEKSNNGFTEIFEERGTRLFLPFSDLDIDNKKKRIFIKTYNYVTYNEPGQAAYTDCRFVSFADIKDDLN